VPEHKQVILLWRKKGERCIEAEIKTEDESIKVLQSLPVHRSGLLAESILNYVYLTKGKSNT
jgi:hypothetical protein